MRVSARARLDHFVCFRRSLFHDHSYTELAKCGGLVRLVTAKCWGVASWAMGVFITTAPQGRRLTWWMDDQGDVAPEDAQDVWRLALALAPHPSRVVKVRTWFMDDGPLALDFGDRDDDDNSDDEAGGGGGVGG